MALGDPREREACLEQEAHQELAANQAQEVQEEQTVLLDTMDHLEQMALPEQVDHQAQEAHQV
jgi:hypothetical protein